MHELAITEHILRRVLYHADKHGAGRVVSIRLQLGEMTGYVDESVQMYWREIARDTIAHAATIIITRIPAFVECANCMTQSQLRDHSGACRGCGSLRHKMVAGNECVIESVELQ